MDYEKIMKGLECCEKCTNEEPFGGCEDCPYNEIGISVQDCRAVQCREAREQMRVLKLALDIEKRTGVIVHG